MRHKLLVDSRDQQCVTNIYVGDHMFRDQQFVTILRADHLRIY